MVWWVFEDDVKERIRDFVGQHFDSDKLTELVWRAPILLLVLLVLVYLYKPPLYKPIYEPMIRMLRRSAFPRRMKQFESDIEFCLLCSVEHQGSLNRFNNRYQVMIDSTVDKYLRIIKTETRDELKGWIIKYEIFKRARDIPKFGVSLGERIRFFAIRFCVGILREEYNKVREIAKAEKGRISK